jgi:hypothetical protein
MRARFLLLCSLWVLVALPVMPAPARAQQWLPDRARTEGRGIDTGPLILHPGIGAEIGWDSNVFLAEHDPVDRAEDSAILRITPHLNFNTPEGPKLSLRGGLNASMRRYFATAESDRALTVNLGENVKLKWQAAPVFAWEIFQDLSRTAVPFTDPGGPNGTASGNTDFGRNQIGVGTRVQASSSSGLFKVGLGYRFDFDVFDANVFDANDSKAHTINADTSWEFLPKTAIVWGGCVRLRSYDDPDAPGLGERNDSTETSSRIGLNGALTDRIGFTLGVGYGAGFYEDNGDYENVLAQVEARWKITNTTSWLLGYDRTTTPSYLGNSMNSDRIKTALSAMFGGVFVLGLKGELTFLAFGPDDDLIALEMPGLAAGETAPSADRNDIHLMTNLNGEYRFTDWFALTGELGYSQNFTKYQYPAAGDVNADPAKWRRFEAWLGVRAFL